MLNEIRSHLHIDPLKQKDIELAFAKQIDGLRRTNIESFKRYIPSLVPLMSNDNSGTHTLFCNKQGRANIVDISTGQVVYGENPREETLTQLSNNLSNAQEIFVAEFEGTSAAVVFGLGLGFHLEELVSTSKFQNIVVYEPNLDFFRCSLSAIKWNIIFTEAKKKGIGLFLQIGEDARNLYDNVEEISSQLNVNRFTLIRHLNSPSFGEISKFLAYNSWKDLKFWNVKANQNSFVDFIPFKTSYRFEDDWEELDKNYPTFKNNLEALKPFFPDLYLEFFDYIPQKWRPVKNGKGIVNSVHIDTNAMLYNEDPVKDSIVSYENFCSHPQKDGLVLGYKGKKLQHYLHYQFVKECEPVLDSLSNELGELPKQIKSMIVFGIGCGYSLVEAFKRSTINKLFVCEPNKDFFYSSLYSVDWAEILSNFQSEKSRLYLNIGDDGSNLVNDLMVQFQSIGPYVLASTYFYQDYFNPRLTRAISQLREQLQVLIAMGDYFDNAKFGLAHTESSIARNTGFLKLNADKLMGLTTKEFPVFIIGNGPSLDCQIELIKEERDNAILVSCGTALQSLYNHGIKPDYHAEIEINRATYDWAMRIGDLDYLSDISLISCNGIHPDTCSLYKDVHLAFKQGESSTVSITEVWQKNQFALLNFSYPTVSNFALDFLSTLGLTQFYFLGVDLGFVDDTHHHSKSSGYYDTEGKELYSYTEQNNTSFVVPGNFRKWVNTKLEFKMSKAVLENVLASRNIDAYNLSDGALIKGARPLDKDYVLLNQDKVSKSRVLDEIGEKAFETIDHTEFTKLYEQRFDKSALRRELQELIEALDEEVFSRHRVDEIIQYQRDKLVASYLSKKSALFFYMNGTVNFANSVFSKILNISEDKVVLEASNDILRYWKRTLISISSSILDDPLGADGSSTFGGQRRKLALQHFAQKGKYSVAVENRAIIHRPEYTFLSAFTPTSETANKLLRIVFRTDTVTRLDDFSTHLDSNMCEVFDTPSSSLDALVSGDGLKVYAPLSSYEVRDMKRYEDHVRINCALFILGASLKSVLAIPKPNFVTEIDVDIPLEVAEAAEKYYVYDTPFFLVMSYTQIPYDKRLLNSGDRLNFVPQLTKRNYLGKLIDEKTFDQFYLGK